MKVGIDLGGSHISLVVIDKNEIIIEKIDKRLMTKEKHNIEETIENYILENIKELSKKYDISQIGISIPGTITKQIIVKSVNLGVEKYDLVKNLRKEIQIPIKIRNDAKSAALAESRIGTLKQYKKTMFLGLGTGIGGAIIIDGKLLDTGDLPGCEFGHMIIQKDGLECNCGKKGCFEKYASMKALKTNLRKSLNLTETTTGKELLDIIIKNPDDERINNIIDEFIDYLSIGISNLINIFEPEAIAIGGSFVYYSNILLDKLKNNILDNNLLFNKRDKLLIFPAELGNDAGIIGSCM